jgi:riboflavin synthase
MFTGIIENVGRIISIDPEKQNLHITIESSFSDELKVDQSVSHNGVCLTVVAINGNRYKVTVVAETLRKSNLGLLSAGDFVNLERSMKMNGRIDGHIVQGHVDSTAVVTSVTDDDGSYIYKFEYDSDDSLITVSKGSVCVNGVSLTVIDPGRNYFSVAIIPYTFEQTNFRSLKKGSVVNLEFDIIGKYVSAYLSARSAPAGHV